MKNRLLAVAALADGLIGLALLIYPAIVIKLLFGTDIADVGLVISRFAGIALLALGIACWRFAAVSATLFGMLTYGMLATSVVLHAVLTLLLASAWVKPQDQGPT